MARLRPVVSRWRTRWSDESTTRPGVVPGLPTAPTCRCWWSATYRPSELLAARRRFPQAKQRWQRGSASRDVALRHSWIATTWSGWWRCASPSTASRRSRWSWSAPRPMATRSFLAPTCCASCAAPRRWCATIPSTGAGHLRAELAGVQEGDPRRPSARMIQSQESDRLRGRSDRRLAFGELQSVAGRSGIQFELRGGEPRPLGHDPAGRRGAAAGAGIRFDAPRVRAGQAASREFPDRTLTVRYRFDPRLLPERAVVAAAGAVAAGGDLGDGGRGRRRVRATSARDVRGPGLRLLYGPRAAPRGAAPFFWPRRHAARLFAYLGRRCWRSAGCARWRSCRTPRSARLEHPLLGHAGRVAHGHGLRPGGGRVPPFRATWPCASRTTGASSPRCGRWTVLLIGGRLREALEVAGADAGAAEASRVGHSRGSAPRAVGYMGRLAEGCGT